MSAVSVQLEAADVRDMVAQWVREATVVEAANGGFAITMPHLLPDNDPVELDLSPCDPDGRLLRLSDGASAADHLWLAGLELTDSRMELLVAATKRLGVELSNLSETFELSLVTDRDHLGDALLRLAQAVQATTYIVYTSAPRVRRAFADDVREALTAHRVTHRSDATVRGRVLEHRVHAVVPGRVQAFVQAVGSPSQCTNTIIAWYDLAEVEGLEYRPFTVLDDATKYTVRQRTVLEDKSEVHTWSAGPEPLIRALQRAA